MPEKGAVNGPPKTLLDPQGRLGQFLVLLDSEAIGHTRDVIADNATDRFNLVLDLFASVERKDVRVILIEMEKFLKDLGSFGFHACNTGMTVHILKEIF